MVKKRIGRAAVALVAAGGLSAAGLVAFAGTAGADYGAGATYQIEISANTHYQTPTATGHKMVSSSAGIWLWFALTPSTAANPTMGGTADFHGSDCQHNVAPTTPPGSTPDQGTNIPYTVTGTTLVIGPMTLAGGGLPTVMVMVPKTYDHYMYSSFGTVFSHVPPLPGSVQVTVAP